MPTRLTEGEKTLIRVLYTEKQKNTQQITEIAPILGIDPAEVRAALQSQWSR